MRQEADTTYGGGEMTMQRKPPHFRYAVLAAVLLGIALGWLAQIFLSESLDQAVEVPTVVAAQYIPAGTILSPEIIRITMLPARLVPRHAVRSPNEVLGRLTKVGIMPGEPILRPRLIPSGVKAGRFRVPILSALGDFIVGWYDDLCYLGQRLITAKASQNVW